jgi:deazaflavin-dependent oxidoreductase (nitroreductase family)
MRALSRTALWRNTTWRLGPFLLGLSGGRLHTGVGLPTALLETRGARTGLPRRNEIIYFHDGDDVIVIASQAGYPGNPSWYHNVVAHPDVRFGGQRFLAVAVEDDASRKRLWALADHVFPAFARYRASAAGHGRKIPIVRLRAVADGPHQAGSAGQ